ncbi:MAG TPA: hypothetical protein VKQ31_02385, partial [Steroidobacteraceae bacterium]|nr:hypothetical protein [Steroidobacteraceae bacterium]
WTQAGVAVEGESLWEFLHHRDDVLRDQSGTTLIPLLIFDQFEEIFTLAQSDEFGRARAARFVTELADLVENRPPKELEASFEEDESAAGRFDFARSDYRILIALREDYLAPLEGLKKEIPSISQNRLRLAPMTGTQALAAVLQPGKGLVTQEVAEAIVRFVAGGAELANAVVEPSLLSLICRELNDARIAQGRSEISLDLLAGSHATILSNFYERALADQPGEVRRIIEDDLLTASGFRENVAEESLVRRFDEAGAAAGTLPLLVNRRLLRIEERLDVRRVELTHDVLCTVVRASRDRRQEREAREATERLLAEQRAREQAARRAAVRARQIAAGCTLLAAVAVVAAVFAYFSSQRAHRLEREAQQSRANAEQLLGYLSDDFGRELESFGQLDVLSEFSERQIDYFDALPADLRRPETVRNAALALVMHSRAKRTLGKLDVAGENADEALELLTRLRAGGDNSEATAIALALAYAAKGRVLEAASDPADLETSQRGLALLAPLAKRPDASAAARRAYVEVGSRIGFEQNAANHPQAALATEEEVMQVAADLGARDLRDLDMGAYYAEAAGWRVTALESLGRYEDARRIGEEGLKVADGVLERRPGYRLALHAEGITISVLGQVAQDELDPREALRAGVRQEEVASTLLKLDPANTTSINNLAVAESQLWYAYWSAGRLHEAMPYRQRQFEIAERATAGGPTFYLNYAGAASALVFAQAARGDAAGARATMARAQAILQKLLSAESEGSTLGALLGAEHKVDEAYAAFERDDLSAALRLAAEAVNELNAIAPQGGAQKFIKSIVLHFAYDAQAEAQCLAGDFAGAEHSAARAVELRKALGVEAMDDRRRLNVVTVWEAMAQARQGRTADAARTIAPVVKFERELAAKNHGDQWVALDLGAALYVEALAQPARRAALLAEALGLVNGLAPQIRSLHDTLQWRARILEAQKKG